MSVQPKGLGRGLSALITSAAEPKAETINESHGLRVRIDLISPSPFQPRRSFDEGKIEELAASIRNQGIIQPLVIRRKENRYELIAGERRWRAAMKAGLSAKFPRSFAMPAIMRRCNWPWWKISSAKT